MALENHHVLIGDSRNGCLSIYVMLVLRGVRFILGMLAPQKTNMSPEALWLGSMKFPFVLRPLFCESVLRVLIYVDI